MKSLRAPLEEIKKVESESALPEVAAEDDEETEEVAKGVEGAKLEDSETKVETSASKTA